MLPSVLMKPSLQKTWEAGEKKKSSGDPFSRSDLDCFLSCVNDVGTGGKKRFCQDNLLKFLYYFCHPWNRWKNIYIIFLSYFFHLWKQVEKNLWQVFFCQDHFSKWLLLWYSFWPQEAEVHRCPLFFMGLGAFMFSSRWLLISPCTLKTRYMYRLLVM